MKKQVLSFNEFIFEAYKIFEKEGLGGFQEALKLLQSSGVPSDAMKKIGDINAISKLVSNKDNQNPQDEIGEGLVRLVQNIGGEKLKISNVIANTNVITYDNLVSGQVMLDKTRANLLDFIYDLNVNNANDKSTVGGYESGKGRKKRTNWYKVQTDKRWASITDMDTYRSYRGIKNDPKDAWAQVLNYAASFFERSPNVVDTTKNTKYLMNSGLLNQEVITSIESDIINTEKGTITSRDMFLGGGSGKSKGFSNIDKDKDVTTGFSIPVPLGASLTKQQSDPTKGSSSSKVSKTPKGYFSIVLYSIGEVTKSENTVPFSDLEKSEKIIPAEPVVTKYTVDLFNNDAEGSPVLFDQGDSKLLPTGKSNIDKVIEEFYSIKSIEVSGFASDEGTEDINKSLCLGRSAAVVKYLKEVKEWNLGNRVTDTKKVNIQPPMPDSMTGAEKEKARKQFRKVELIISGTKSITSTPPEQITIEVTPTKSSFNTDKVNIYQTVVTFEVEEKKTSNKVKR